jgi:hypothetical protein
MRLPFDGTLKRKDTREAADSGILLWRQNFFIFLPFFAIPLWIFAFTLRLLPGNLQYFSWLIVWWLKPLFDRIILHIISIRFFERDAKTKRLCQGLFKTLIRGLPGDLLWRRFSLLRSSLLPVRVLERNIKSADAFNNRKKSLLTGGINYCFLLTIWGFAVEIALLYGNFLFLVSINQLILNGMIFWDNFLDIEIYFYALWCFNYMLVETIYVCMGFSLYINSRVEVEGWDIEITFRNIAEKLKNKGKYAVLIIMLFCFLFSPVNIFASDYQTADNVPLDTLKIVLDSPDFGGEKDTWGIRFKNPAQQRNVQNINTDALNRLRQIFAYILWFILISAFAGLLIFLFIYYRKTMIKKTVKTNIPAVKLPLGIQADNSVSMIKKALNFHEQGEIRLAWGYCTAAAIQSWAIYNGITFPPDATETDCANAVIKKTDNNSSANDSLAEKFKKLIEHWVYLAYAGRLPPAGSFEEAIVLCETIGVKNG